uniref:Major capsid protein n=1 Tax=Dulem virus 204 TaxID=3145681 RepID=A0AAU8BA35_9VIRU
MAQLKFDPKPHLELNRSSFNLSNTKIFDCQQNRLIPTAIYDCVPGDNFLLGVKSLVRTSPLVRPAFTSNLKKKNASFFCAYRTLWKDFENFYSGGRTGDEHYPLPCMSIGSYIKVGSFHDYADLPIIGSSPSGSGSTLINALYLLAYLKIWNDYFRNPTIDIEIDVYERKVYTPGNNTPLKFLEQNSTFEGVTVVRLQYFLSWCFAYISGDVPSSYRPTPNADGIVDFYPNATGQPAADLQPYLPALVNLPRDIFTSALPQAQSGTPVSLGLDGSIDGLGLNPNSFVNIVTPATGPTVKLGFGSIVGNFDTNNYPSGYQAVGLSYLNKGTLGINNDALTGSPSTENYTQNPLRLFGSQLNNIASKSSRVNISGIYPRELRLVFGLDLWQQLRNLTGNRYKDILYGYYGVTLPDNRLQLAEYIGGSSQDIYTSEVLQTSQTDNTPLGSLGGHQISSNSDYHGSYFVQEPGCIINLTWINSNSLYTQGLRRDWRKFTLDDFFFPSFENIGDQEIRREEICFTYKSGSSLNRDIFGFAPRYYEYKYYDDKVCGHLRTTELYWTQARIFGVDDVSSEPSFSLNSSFIKPNLIGLNRIYQNLETNPDTTFNYFIRHVNQTVAFRPMKNNSIGMLIDHF